MGETETGNVHVDCRHAGGRRLTSRSRSREAPTTRPRRTIGMASLASNPESSIPETGCGALLGRVRLRAVVQARELALAALHVDAAAAQDRRGPEGAADQDALLRELDVFLGLRGRDHEVAVAGDHDQASVGGGERAHAEAARAPALLAHEVEALEERLVEAVEAAVEEDAAGELRAHGL